MGSYRWKARCSQYRAKSAASSIITTCAATGRLCGQSVSRVSPLDRSQSVSQMVAVIDRRYGSAICTTSMNTRSTPTSLRWGFHHSR